MASVVEIVDELKKRNFKIATAESCTGGMIASSIVDLPGVSAFFEEGVVTYSNDAKKKYLFVSDEVLKEHGAVSEECAYAMADGLSQQTKAQVCICSTGIAGPGGGTKEKPVGLVYLSCKVLDRITVKKCLFKGTRTEIRKAATEAAFSLAYDCLTN